LNNKQVQILEFGIFWALLVESISETVRDRGNLLIYYNLKLSAQSIQRKNNTLKLDEKLKFYTPSWPVLGLKRYE